jgi:hypothetical protein
VSQSVGGEPVAVGEGGEGLDGGGELANTAVETWRDEGPLRRVTGEGDGRDTWVEEEQEIDVAWREFARIVEENEARDRTDDGDLPGLEHEAVSRGESEVAAPLFSVVERGADDPEAVGAEGGVAADLAEGPLDVSALAWARNTESAGADDGAARRVGVEHGVDLLDPLHDLRVSVEDSEDTVLEVADEDLCEARVSLVDHPGAATERREGALG